MSDLVKTPHTSTHLSPPSLCCCCCCVSLTTTSTTSSLRRAATHVSCAEILPPAGKVIGSGSWQQQLLRRQQIERSPCVGLEEMWAILIFYRGFSIKHAFFGRTKRTRRVTLWGSTWSLPFIPACAPTKHSGSSSSRRPVQGNGRLVLGTVGVAV